MPLDVNALQHLTRHRAHLQRELQAARAQLDEVRRRRDGALAALQKIEDALAAVPVGLVLDSNIPATATIDEAIARLEPTVVF